jgi:hypothetical protein
LARISAFWWVATSSATRRVDAPDSAKTWPLGTFRSASMFGASPFQVTRVLLSANRALPLLMR